MLQQYTVRLCSEQCGTLYGNRPNIKRFVLLKIVMLVRMFGKLLQERGENLENYLYYSDPFFAYNNSLYIEKTINGKPVNIKLSNFLARITEDITCTNGAENERFLSIVGTDEKGKDLPKITVPLKNFSQLDWAQEYWGMNCIIEAGYGNRDSLRQAIQSTAKYAETKTIYGTTGWWKTADGWKFCMPGNSEAEVELTEKTKGYSFKTDSDINETMTVMKNLPYSVAPKNIMFTMLAYTIGSVLGTFMAKAGKETKTVIMLYGKTGSMKTTLSLLINSLFGRFNEDNIPMNFRDTPKSILNYCFTLKDCAVIIDDYHPGSGREQSSQDATTQALIRGICNREARGTLDKNGRQRAAKRPQCNVIMTAEYLPNVGESGVARFLSLELKPGDINLKELTDYQKYAEDGILSHFTFLATEMLKAKYLCKENGVKELLEKLKSTFLTNRKFYKDKSDEMNFHIRPRLCDDLANLKIGFELYCDTLVYYNAITEETKNEMINALDEFLMKLALSQQSLTETEQPTEIFLRKLRSLIDVGKVNLIGRMTAPIEKPRNLIGYFDDENFYFESDEAYASVIKACNDVGEHFPLTQKALIKALKNEGISICSKGECTRNVRVFGTPKRLICISKETFNKNLPPEEETICDDEELPFGPGEIIFEEKSGF